MSREGRLRLLVVDSNQRESELVRTQLLQSHQPWDVVQARRLSDGLNRLATQSFDAILIDLDLPDSSGLQSYVTLRARAPGVPVVMLSGNSLPHADFPADGLEFTVAKEKATPEVVAQLVQYAAKFQQLQTRLDGSERQLRMLAEQLPAMLWTTDEQMQFTSMRGRDLSVIGLRPEDVIGKTVAEIFTGSSASHVAGELHRRALSGESTSLELAWNRHWFHVHVEPLRNVGEDEVYGTIGVALDVTGEQKLKRDVHAAHQIQEHLLPSRSPELKGFDIAGRCFPAEDCSGDFFDFIPLPARRLAIILADVSGHGFGPAILAAAIRSYLRMAAVLGNQVHEMLALANRLLLSDGDLTPFASVFAASLDPETQTLRFASAGHPAYLIHADGKTTRLEGFAVPIGVKDDEMFTLSSRIQLQPGDIVLLSSDGVFEARSPNGEHFGIQRAVGVVREHRFADAEAIVESLHSAAVAFAGGVALDDDLTIIVVKVVPVSGSVRETWTM